MVRNALLRGLVVVTALLAGIFFTSIVRAQSPEYPASTRVRKVKVFILAGQFNMEGRGLPEPLAWQVTQETYRERYKHFIKNGDYAAFTKKVAETTDPDDKRKSPTYLWSSRGDVFTRRFLISWGSTTRGRVTCTRAGSDG